MNTRTRLGSRFAVVLVAAAVFLAAPGTAHAAPEDSPAGGGDGVEVRLDLGVPIQDFLKTASEALGKPIQWMEGDKSIQNRKLFGARPLRIPRQQMLQALRALLVPHELVVTSLGSEGSETYFVSNAREQAAILKLKPEAVEVNDANVGRLDGQDGWYIAAVIRVKHLDSLRDARQALGRIVTQNNIGQVTEVPAAGAFVVTDFAPNVAAIYRLLKVMDVPPVREGEPTQHFLPLTHAKAASVRFILQEQFGTVRARAPAPQPGAAPAATPGGDEVPRFSADDATNQIVVTCGEAEFAKVRRVVEALDQPPTK